MSARRLYGVLAQFETADDILAAAAAVREAGYTRWDVHTPYPIHGMDAAMGIRSTVLPWIVLLMGVCGAILGYTMQYWMNAVDYPFLVSGKPMHSSPSQIPVTFELTILLSAFGAVLGCLILNGLPRLQHPLLDNERFRRASDDRFFVVIESRDPRFSERETVALLRSLGAGAIEGVEG